MSVKIGVIGLGFIGEKYCDVLSNIEGAQLVGIADSNPQKLKQVAEKYKVEAWLTYEELLSRDDIDAVAVCTPDHLHREPAVTAARAGKHLIVEKPLATNVQAAEEIVYEAEKQGVILQVGHVLRFNSRYWEGRSAIEKGEIGELIYINAYRRALRSSPHRLKGRVSPVFYLGVHDLDIVRWYAGDDVEQVYASSVRKMHTSLDVDDTVVATICFKKGAMAVVESTWTMHPASNSPLQSGLLAVGTQGTVQVYWEPTVMITSDKYGVITPDTELWPMINGTRWGDLHVELCDFIRCLKDQTMPYVTGHDGLETVRIAAAIEKSALLGQPVKLP